jgi:hypothetical protein
MKPLEDLIAPFIQSVASGRTEIYNEFSLQHELGISLRDVLLDRKIQFERNVSFFFPSKAQFTKREIDISVFSPDRKDLEYAIELKYPRNGQYPEQMFSFCKDVAFAEELAVAGFSIAGLVIFAADRLFYSGPNDGIYGFFRGGQQLHGQIQKPTGNRDTETLIRGKYIVQWKLIVDSLKYAVIEVKRGD